MENKSLRALAIFIIIGFVFIVNFAFLEFKVELLKTGQISLQKRLTILNIR